MSCKGSYKSYFTANHSRKKETKYNWKNVQHKSKSMRGFQRKLLFPNKINISRKLNWDFTQAL